MADLLQNYGGQIAQAASIPGAQANQWATAGLTQQQAQAAAYKNQIMQSALPYMQGIIARMTARQQQQQVSGATDPSENAGIPGTPAPMGTQSQPQGPSQQQPMGQSPYFPMPTGTNQPGATPTVQTQPPTTSQGTASQDAVQSVPQQTTPTTKLTSEQLNQFRDHTNSMAANHYQKIPTSMDQQTADDMAGAQALASFGIVGPELAQSVQTSWEAPIMRANQQREIKANNMYSLAEDVLGVHGVDSNGVSQEWKLLYQLNPEIASSIPSTTPEDKIRQMATTMGGSAFRYTDRAATAKYNDAGVYIDTTTGRPVLDAPVTGISQTDYDKYLQQGEQKVDGTVGGIPHRQVSQWEMDNFNYQFNRGFKQGDPNHQLYTDQTDYAQQQAIKARAGRGPLAVGTTAGEPSTTNPATGMPPSAAGSPAITAPPAATNTATPVGGGTVTPNPGAASTQGLSSQQAQLVKSNPFLTPSNLDFSHAEKPEIFTNPMGDIKPEQQADVQMYAQQKVDLDTKAGTAIANATKGNSVDRFALSKVDNANTGPMAEALSQMQTLVDEFKGSGQSDFGQFLSNALGANNHQNADYQALTKILAGRSITGFEKDMQEAGGGSMRASALLAGLTINKLAPSTEMAKQAIKTLLKYDIANNNYDLQKYGMDLPAYKAAGGKRSDPAFETAYATTPNGDQYSKVNQYMSQMDDMGNYKPTATPQANAQQQRQPAPNPMNLPFNSTNKGEEGWQLHYKANDPSVGSPDPRSWTYVNPKDHTQYRLAYTGDDVSAAK